MPDYQLPVAIALAVTLVVSLATYVWSASYVEKPALPTFAEGEEALARDPFDVTKPEDLVDGTPVDEDAFWRRMRLRKLAMSILLAAILIIQSVCLGWSIVEDDRANIAVYSLHVAFALYTLVVAARAINQTYSVHSRSVIHLSALTFVAATLLTTLAIIPTTPLPGPVTSFYESSKAPLALWYAVVVLYAATLAIAVTTPRGPLLHFPTEQIYSEKTVMQTTSKYEDNVCRRCGEREPRRRIRVRRRRSLMPVMATDCPPEK